MKKFAIIVAAGTGKRMGSSTPKQFLLLRDKPVLYYSLKVFLDAFDDLRIILVLPAEYSDIGKEVIDAYFDYNRIDVISGGESRFDSVNNGLQLVTEDSVVFVHDAARCLVTTDLIRRCYEHTLQLGSAVPVITPKDSMRILNEERNDNEVLDRDKVVLIQTPQTFYSKILKAAYDIGYKERFTDEATVVETLGMKISLIEGEEKNIKITTPVDLLFAETLMDSMVENSTS
jgi:2-C-methyl-D-erythritol 4-phosphate cytidylyltransferase